MTGRNPQTNEARYADVRDRIRDGDLLLFRRRGLVATAGRGRHSHAAKAAWWGTFVQVISGGVTSTT